MNVSFGAFGQKHVRDFILLPISYGITTYKIKIFITMGMNRAFMQTGKQRSVGHAK